MVFSCKTYPNNLCFTYKKTPVCVHFSSQCILELPSLYVIDQLSHVWCLIMVPTLAAHLLEQNKRVTKRSNTSVLSADKSVISRVTLTQTAAKTETDFKLWVYTIHTELWGVIRVTLVPKHRDRPTRSALFTHTHTHTHTCGVKVSGTQAWKQRVCFWCGIRHDHVPVSINYSCAHTQKLPLSEGLYCCDTQHNYLSEWKHECHADDAFTRSLSGSSSNRPMYTCFTHILHPAKPAVSKPTANCLPKSRL